MAQNCPFPPIIGRERWAGWKTKAVLGYQMMACPQCVTLTFSPYPDLALWQKHRDLKKNFTLLNGCPFKIRIRSSAQRIQPPHPGNRFPMNDDIIERLVAGHIQGVGCMALWDFAWMRRICWCSDCLCHSNLNANVANTLRARCRANLVTTQPQENRTLILRQAQYRFYGLS